MNARVFDGDRRIDAWPADARIAAYGDGLFETLRVDRGRACWWSAHWERLRRDAGRLRIALPDEALVRSEVAALFGDAGDGVLKLVVGRGGGGRGYAPIASTASQWMLARHALPSSNGAAMHVGWCETRLSIQPALAGIKHCNRLEQVLARAECVDGGFDEGLVLDTESTVIGATSANVFVLRDGHWQTPLVDRCGVAGVCRAHLLDLLDPQELRLTRQQVEHSDAMFLCNAVRGILPVDRLDGRSLHPHPAVGDAARRLAGIHPGFAFRTPIVERS